MKNLSKLLYFLLLAIAIPARTQTNAGMPLIKEMAEHFFYSYVAPNTNSHFEFQKKEEGWWVRLFDGMGSGFGTPQLFWSKMERRYLPLDFQLQSHPDSATVAETMATYPLSNEDMAQYDRSLYYGYDGWEGDVIRTLERNAPTSDSLWEALGKAYDYYAGGYIMPQNLGQVQDGDTDRVILHENKKLPLSRIRKFIFFERKALFAFEKIYRSNPNYQCAFYDISWRLNTIRMSAAVTLSCLDYDSLSSSFVDEVVYPHAALQRARQILQHLPSNSILFTDKDTTTFPIMYLQMKGERRDVVTIDNLIFILKRSIGYFDRKYHGSLFRVKAAVYSDSAFQMALFQSDDRDTADYRLDSFLARLYASPDAPGLPHIDSSIGRIYRYFSRHPYMTLDPKKASSFYRGKAVARRLNFELSDSYLGISDILNLDIVNSNLLTRHIFYTNPDEHPIFKPYCVRTSPFVYEFIPMEIRQHRY